MTAINFNVWKTTQTNNIGIAGTAGFGVGVCPIGYPGLAGLYGYTEPLSDTWGNYQFWDGSIMCWIPACAIKWGTGSNGLGINVIDVKPYSYFGSVAAANAAGYYIHRAFYDNNTLMQGVFVDKFLCSNNGGTASSLRNGNPLSSSAAHNPFSGLTGAPPNFYYGAIAAAKTRGADFFPRTSFIGHLLATLSLAHAQASTSTDFCAWYDGAGITNFPKGCNNNALGDANDASILYVSDGYANAGKTGSANLFARTTHNGQNCGVCDLNGNMWEIAPGLATDSAGTAYYVLNATTQMKSVTGGNTLATDLWGATGLAALYTNLGATYGAALASSTLKTFGSAAQVFSEAVSGNAWLAAGAGIPLVGGVGGTNAFGSDGFWDYRPADMCPLAGGGWNNYSSEGVWALTLGNVRGASSDNGGFRAALYVG